MGAGKKALRDASSVGLELQAAEDERPYVFQPLEKLFARQAAGVGQGIEQRIQTRVIGFRLPD